MVNLETERARLKDRGEEGSERWKEIEKVRGKILLVHQKREADRIGAEEARSDIILLLEEDVLFGISD